MFFTVNTDVMVLAIAHVEADQDGTWHWIKLGIYLSRRSTSYSPWFPMPSQDVILSRVKGGGGKKITLECGIQYRTVHCGCKRGSTRWYNVSRTKEAAHCLYSCYSECKNQADN